MTDLKSLETEARHHVVFHYDGRHQRPQPPARHQVHDTRGGESDTADVHLHGALGIIRSPSPSSCYSSSSPSSSYCSSSCSCAPLPLPIRHTNFPSPSPFPSTPSSSSFERAVPSQGQQGSHSSAEGVAADEQVEGGVDVQGLFD